MENEERIDLRETYDFLLSPRRIADEIWRKDIRRKELRACLLPAAITYDKDRVQTTPEDRIALVKECGWFCIETNGHEDCLTCPAAEWCGDYQDWKDDEGEGR